MPTYYSNAMGENGYFQQTLLAYGRAGEMCVNCETTLEKNAFNLDNKFFNLLHSQIASRLSWVNAYIK
jgi:formamidopyrimidine-DNA glycosylase